MNIVIRCLNATPEYDLKQMQLMTVGKKPIKEKHFDLNYWLKIVKAGHSCNEIVSYMIIVKGIPKSVMNQITRHTAYHPRFSVKSSRPDWTGVPRSTSDTTDMIIVANIKALLEISRQRLCYKAEEQSREFWKEVRDCFKFSDNSLMQAIGFSMKASCGIYKGCPEIQSCGRC